MAVSRRDFLTRVGRAGGYSAAFLVMRSMGLMEADAATTVNAAPGSGKGVKVVILGGGIAGLVSAYELCALGYECTVLESRQRPGGRNWTVRGGDKVTFLDGTTQTCSWDEGHYQNFGPARLPSVHHTMLGYCQKLGVPLEVEVNMTRSSFLQNDNANGGKPMVLRQVENDTRGHVSELLEKAINQGALDQDMSKEDRDRVLSFLRSYGPLDEAGKYSGSDRAGYAETPGAGDQTGVLSKPIDMHTLLDEDFWQAMLFDEQFDMQATMFQPVGGMDRIPYAFAKALGGVVQYDAPVTEIRKTAKGVKIGYTSGGAKSIEADYCICALPLTILKKIPNDLSAPYKKVIDECKYASAFKIAWESRRFWEQDYNIYGGLEFVNVGCSPIWFPSAGMFTSRGVLVSGYTEESRSPLVGLTLEQKFAESRKAIERLHPGHGKELEKPMYVTWGQIPHNEGSWIRSYGPGQDRYPGMALTRQTGDARSPAAARTFTNPGYETLIEPDGPIIFAGDHVSHIVAWQEGAALSALRAVGQVNDKTKAARLAGGGSQVG
jgi:monoamine oxidase